ncbi:uncharacterized protein METZ01_LOCUS471973, partial [marine metagenome]
MGEFTNQIVNPKPVRDVLGTQKDIHL